jgi:hypothetical protein
MTRPAILTALALAFATVFACAPAKAETYFNPAWADPAWIDTLPESCGQICNQQVVARELCRLDTRCNAKLENARLAFVSAACDRNPTTVGVLLCKWRK